MNVLITAASRRVALVNMFSKACEKYDAEVITVDRDSDSAAMHFASRSFVVSGVKSDNYIDQVKDIAISEGVKLIVPTYDGELLLWPKHKAAFNKIGMSVSISPEETVGVCRDKVKTADYFSSRGIPFAQSYHYADLPESLAFPMFVRPADGGGSVDSFKLENRADLDYYSQNISRPIISEYLEGKEFTVDAFFAADGRLLRCIPRFRLAVRAGVSDRGVTFENRKLTNYIEKIGDALKFEGAVNIQGKIDNDRIRFFEINPRFSGGIQLSVAAGVNFAELLLKEFAGEELKPDLFGYRTGIKMVSYERSLFFDQECQLPSIFK